MHTKPTSDSKADAGQNSAKKWSGEKIRAIVLAIKSRGVRFIDADTLEFPDGEQYNPVSISDRSETPKNMPAELWQLIDDYVTEAHETKTDLIRLSVAIFGEEMTLLNLLDERDALRARLDQTHEAVSKDTKANEQERDALKAENERLRSALEAVEKLGADGVIERRETGKPTWSLCDALRTIARAALAQKGDK